MLFMRPLLATNLRCVSLNMTSAPSHDGSTVTSTKFFMRLPSATEAARIALLKHRRAARESQLAEAVHHVQQTTNAGNHTPRRHRNKRHQQLKVVTSSTSKNTFSPCVHTLRYITSHEVRTKTEDMYSRSGT